MIVSTVAEWEAFSVGCYVRSISIFYARWYVCIYFIVLETQGMLPRLRETCTPLVM